jgi:protein TonB
MNQAKRRQHMLPVQNTFNTPSSFVKLPIYFVLALIVTFSLFVLMQYLIQSPKRAVVQVIPEFEIGLYQVREEPDVKINKRIKPPPKITEPPKRIVEQPTETPTDLPTMLPTIDVSVDTIDNSMPKFIKQSGQASPIFRVSPNYPMTAQRDGIEGWVKLSFSIDKTGRVFDAKVMNAEPKRLFDRAALKALKRWKYKPTINNGEPQIQRGQSVMLEFNLEQG